MKTLQELVEEGFIPTYYVEYLPPNYLCVCGKPLYGKTTLKWIGCQDKNCISRKMKRLKEICKRMDIPSRGLPAIEDSVVKLLPYNNLLAICKPNLTDVPEPLLSITDYMYNKSHTAATLIQKMAIPGLDTQGRYIFSKIRSLQHFDEEVNRYETLQEFTAAKLNRDNITDSIDTIAETIMDYMPDINNALRGNLVKTENIVCIDITNNVLKVKHPKTGAPLTKEQYVMLLNAMLMPVLYVELESATKLLDYLVLDTKHDTGTSRTVTRLQEKRKKQMIYRSDELVKLLLDRKEAMLND